MNNSKTLYFLNQLKKIEEYDKKKEYNKKKKDKLINIFPNYLLLENSIINKEKNLINNNQNKKININNIKKNKDIWEILDDITNKNNSEKFENIISEINSTDKKENDHTICYGCKKVGTLIEDYHSNSLICSNCGMVNEEYLDNGPEWRQYNNDDNRNEGLSRCGCTTNFFFPKSSQGTIVAGLNNSRLKRKQKWNSIIYKERSLNQVFEYITLVCSKNNIPKIIIDTTKILYKRLSDCKHKSGINFGKQIIIRGENRISIIAACVHKACEINKSPRTLKEISEIFNIEEKKITKGKKQFEKIIKNSDENEYYLDVENFNTAEDYIKRHYIKLKLTKKQAELACKISNNCSKMKLASDHNPQSVAAGSILLMSSIFEIKIDKKEISKLFDTSDVTISKIYNKILPYYNALIDDELTEHLIKKFKINGK